MWLFVRNDVFFFDDKFGRYYVLALERWGHDDDYDRRVEYANSLFVHCSDRYARGERVSVT